MRQRELKRELAECKMKFLCARGSHYTVTRYCLPNGQLVCRRCAIKWLKQRERDRKAGLWLVGV